MVDTHVPTKAEQLRWLENKLFDMLTYPDVGQRGLARHLRARIAEQRDQGKSARQIVAAMIALMQRMRMEALARHQQMLERYGRGGVIEMNRYSHLVDIETGLGGLLYMFEHWRVHKLSYSERVSIGIATLDERARWWASRINLEALLRGQDIIGQLFDRRDSAAISRWCERLEAPPSDGNWWVERGFIDIPGLYTERMKRRLNRLFAQAIAERRGFPRPDKGGKMPYGSSSRGLRRLRGKLIHLKVAAGRGAGEDQTRRTVQDRLLGQFVAPKLLALLRVWRAEPEVSELDVLDRAVHWLDDLARVSLRRHYANENAQVRRNEKIRWRWRRWRWVTRHLGWLPQGLRPWDCRFVRGHQRHLNLYLGVTRLSNEAFQVYLESVPTMELVDAGAKALSIAIPGWYWEVEFDGRDLLDKLFRPHDHGINYAEAIRRMLESIGAPCGIDTRQIDRWLALHGFSPLDPHTVVNQRDLGAAWFAKAVELQVLAGSSKVTPRLGVTRRVHDLRRVQLAWRADGRFRPATSLEHNQVTCLAADQRLPVVLEGDYAVFEGTGVLWLVTAMSVFINNEYTKTNWTAGVQRIGP